MEEVNGYKRRGAIQTAGIVAAVATAAIVVTVFLIDRIIGPNLIAKADERFETRIERHKLTGAHRDVDRRLESLQRQQRTIEERLEKLVTKDDFDRFIQQLNRTIYGDSGRSPTRK